MPAEEYVAIRDRETAAHLMAFTAGVRSDPPSCLLQDPRDSVDFLLAQRVVGRLITAIDKTGDPAFGEVRQIALETYDKWTGHFNFLLEKLAKFIKLYCYDMDVVLFKCHCFFYTNDFNIRATGDLDIAVSKPSVLLERVNADNIPHLRDRLPLHEVANLDFEGAHIDLHRYYPAWEITPYITHLVEDGGGCTLSTHRAHETGLPVAELIANGLAVDPHGARFFVPSRTTAATITLAASHRDFVTQAAWYLKNHPPQRLSDLCEVRDALDDPGFSKAEFIELIKRQGLRDALRWFAGNTEEILGDTRLSAIYREAFGDVESSAIGDDWMLHLVAGGFWLPFTRDAVRDLTILVPTHEVTDSLKVPAMTLADGERKVFALDDPAVQKEIGVVLVGHTLLDNHTLEISRDGLVLSLAFKAGVEIHIEYRSYFELNGECLEWDNLYTPEVEYLCGSEAAYKAMVSSSYEPGSRMMRLQYRLPEDQRDDELNMVVAVSAPAMPWESERGYMAALRIRLT
ncbi:hypothetical protein [Mesorhizobium sp. BE184]|uniref:hypothetical protein n=1 Tax=Mesorhizobium sp. BE184 TaxID=2817714 RepID=UPI00285BB3BB|nr:hypothetical protein [Mesorhizobium sp. BE184]MDR7033149.1 hypothetical protein [Mesorhizobium sp. BE184]